MGVYVNSIGVRAPPQRCFPKKLATGTCVFYYEFKSLLIVPDMVLETPMYALLTQWFDTYTRRVRNSGQGHPTGWETQPLRMPVKA